MSRSFKKQPVEKYGRFAKKVNLHNKRLRKRVNQSDLEDENLVLPKSEELTNAYDVCDSRYDPRTCRGIRSKEYIDSEIKRIKRRK